jgi:signal transduction histidine kinase/ligand-binding sensor domain-containing protein
LVATAAAGEFANRAWETDDGLPHNGINAVLQTPEGFLWLATQNGLVRFDGIEFRKWRSPLLADAKASAVRAVIEEDARTLLIANDTSGLARWRDGAVTTHPMAAQLGGRRIVVLFREAEGVFWVLFSSREVWRCHGEKVEIFPSRAGLEIYWPLSFARDGNGTVYIARGAGVEKYEGGDLVPTAEFPAQACTISEGRSGGIWVATQDRLCRLERGVVTEVQKPVPWTPDWPPTALMEDRGGALWIGTKAQGVLRRENEEVLPVTTSYPRINDLLEDAEGNVWVATAGGGLNRLQRARFTLLGEENGVAPDIVGSVCEDAMGDIWFGNRNCMGRVRGNRLEAPELPEAFQKKAMPLCPDAAGNLWLAVNNKLARWNAAEPDAPKWVEVENTGSIHAIFAARDGGVWIAGETGPLARIQDETVESFGPEAGYTGTRAQVIGESAVGEIWVGTERGELFQRKGGRFIGHGREEGLPGSAIRAIHGDAQGTVWIGTSGGGLLAWRHGRFTAVTEMHGLPDDTVSQIVEDDFGSLWIGSSRALAKVRKADLLDCVDGKSVRISPTVFGKADGVAGFSASANYQPSAWKTRSGQLWFASRKGLVTTAPSGQAGDGRQTRVHLESFTADGQTVAPTQATVASATKKLEFQYTAPTFISPEKVQFRHRLEGFDTDWTETGTQRYAAYSQLPPGRYVFKVTARNGEMAWNEEGASLAFEVLPAWWETWWARSGAMVAGAAGLVALVRFWSHRRLKARLAHLESRRRIEVERTRIARDLHDSLGASLTQAGMLAEELCEDCHDLEEMKECSSELASRVRTIARDLDAAVWAVSPKNDSLSSLCSYLCQFSLEYFRQTSTRCRVHTSDDIPPAPLTPEVRHHLFLTAREAMNNVLKHAHAREVQLTMEMRGPIFEMLIEDDGRGFSVATAEAAERNGLRNMRARMAEIGGTLEIRSSADGTAVRITLPVPHEAGGKPREHDESRDPAVH